ncbi:response regulator [Weissella halotolerans DSM 20190]|uniref:Response regulator n=1 Tax=Weissella halotolerans DSM 20190 TaxID=1123500 RepID=A0A0R2G7Y3_9LACO|nr:response regulator [Weissella halotolerans DSM 20190]
MDDEPALVKLLTYNLERAGFEVLTASDGQGLVERLQTGKERIDLVLLDIMLPKESGIDITQKLRAQNSFIPIIMITALDEEVDKVVGLEMGADDYITKPFSPREVVARVKAVLRRFEHAQAASQQDQRVASVKDYGILSVDTDRVLVKVANQRIKLTPKEYELLVYLTEREGRVLDRETILHGVWGFAYAGVDTRMVDMHVSHLRDKIEIDPKHPQMLKTVRGMGYRFVRQLAVEDEDD